MLLLFKIYFITIEYRFFIDKQRLGILHKLLKIAPLRCVGVQLNLDCSQCLLVALLRRRLERITGVVHPHLHVVGAAERGDAPHGAVGHLSGQAAVQLLSTGALALGVLDGLSLVVVR